GLGGHEEAARVRGQEREGPLRAPQPPIGDLQPGLLPAEPLKAQPSTTVPIGSPNTTRLMLPGVVSLKTRICMLLSRQSVAAVESMTPMRSLMKRSNVMFVYIL